MAKKSYDLLFKLLLIGDSAVGKSSLVVRFTDGMFNQNFITTIGIDFKIKTVEMDGKLIKLQIWDTAGQERFETITTSYYRGAMGIILIYDITNHKSFENVSKWMRLISEHANEDVEKLLVGNKCDMVDKRTVPTEEAQKLASESRIGFIEVSAKEDINVTKAFTDLARLILAKMNRKQAPQQADARVIQLSGTNNAARRQLPNCCHGKRTAK